MTTPPTSGPWLPPADHWAAPLTWGPPRPTRPPWTAKLWEPDTESTASPVVLPAALVVGILAALILRMENVGSAFLVTGAGVLTVGFLARGPPTTDVLAPAAPVRTARPWAWAVPLVPLDVLFAAFVLVQLTVLFGGREHELRTEGLTFAEYARQGFWQLTAVTVLTLAVVATAVRTARRATATERALIRALLGPLCGLALVVVASALHRMSLYEKEFGFTRLRVAATTVELFLGAVLVLLLVAGLRMSGTWLPRAVVAAAAVALLGLTAINPDAYIAERNVDRFERTGRIDLYLPGDVVGGRGARPAPIARRCPRLCSRGHRPRAGCVLGPWFDTNVARNRARSLLDRETVGVCDRFQLFR
ncbi:DUF4173 domain-containing protein [Sporichthya sp.]|uniref:DUF4153 domain-containing protein n=1 Tax=Sporichthya sp. TaxID=65475 RepID=UPI0025DA7A0E|nr:DUF4173 domain-containing protein [Sporichthya sp.]